MVAHTAGGHSVRRCAGRSQRQFRQQRRTERKGGLVEREKRVVGGDVGLVRTPAGTQKQERGRHPLGVVGEVLAAVLGRERHDLRLPKTEGAGATEREFDAGLVISGHGIARTDGYLGRRAVGGGDAVPGGSWRQYSLRGVAGKRRVTIGITTERMGFGTDFAGTGGDETGAWKKHGGAARRNLETPSLRDRREGATQRLTTKRSGEA